MKLVGFSSRIKDLNNNRLIPAQSEMLNFVVGSDPFAKKLADRLGVKNVGFDLYRYEDGEVAPRILADYEELEGKHGAVVGRLSYPTTPEKVSHFLESVSRIVGNLTDEELYKAESVDVVLPWYMTSRQDHNPKTDPSEKVRSRDKGKDIGYKELIKTMKGKGASRIVTFSPHFHVEEGVFQRYGLDIVSLSGVEALARHFSDVDKDTVIVARDEKAKHLADRLGRLRGLEWVSLEKERLTSTEVLYTGKFDAKGRNILAIDDVTTGAGIEKFLTNVENSANIDFSIIHAALSPEGYRAINRLLNNHQIRQFIPTDTTNTAFNRTNATVIPELTTFLKEHPP